MTDKSEMHHVTAGTVSINQLNQLNKEATDTANDNAAINEGSSNHKAC